MSNPRANGAKRRSGRKPGGRGLLIPLGYLHPGKCEHSEVQSHRFCHGRFSSLCACASHHWFQNYGGQWRTTWRANTEGFRKGENEDKNDCHKTTRDTWEEINAGKRQRSAKKPLWIDTKQVCWYIIKLLRIYIKGRRSRIQSVHC